MFSRQHRKARPFFILADILLIWLAFEAAYFTRTHLPFERIFFLGSSVRLLLLLASLLAWIFAGLWFRCYDSILRVRRSDLLLNVARQTVAGTIAVILFEYIQRIDLSRPFLGLLFLYSCALLTSFRLLARFLAPSILGSDSSSRYLLVVGTGPTALRVANLIERSQAYGLRLLGFLDETPGELSLSRTYPVHSLHSLSDILRRDVIDEIVFAVDSQRLSGLEETFLLCEDEGVRTRLHLDFFPHVQARIDLERLEGEPMLTFSGAPHDDVRLLIKRVVDCALALIALTALSPLLLLITALIRLTSRGPAIFRQQRCGLNGRRFTLYKFRTMVEGAEALKAGLAHLNVKSTAFKIPNDPRLTPIGRWLRKFSLDELPQLWNIVRGEMAIVGPRPAVPDEVQRYQRWQRRRLRMRPGLTCLWTLAGRDSLEFDEWMRLDLAYIDTWSLSLDLAIILRTIPHVVLGRGAH